MDILKTINAAKKGDVDARDELLTYLKGTVKVCARPFFLIDGDEDDLLQEGMIGADRAIDTYDAERNVGFKTYAAACIRGRIIDALRKSVANKNFALNNSLSIDGIKEHLCTNTTNPEDIVIQKETLVFLIEEANLSELEKAVLEMYLCKLSYREIAQQLSKDVKDIDNSVQRIKSKMKKLIGKV